MDKNLQKYIILIPAYNPSEKLVNLVRDLQPYNVAILVVNDGTENKTIFNKLKKYNNLKIIGYNTNHGKGYAMKYGIKYYFDNYYNDYKGIITVDADYQHLPSDIMRIASAMETDNIVLGTRDFNSKDVPLPNRLGNQLTSIVFKILYGKKISDTQTGLRGIPNSLLEKTLYVKGERFEYEMEALIYYVNNKIKLKEIKIETIYYEKSESKFHKVFDSIKIYKVMLTEAVRFLITSLLSSFIDIILFTIVLSIFNYLGDISIIIATIIARLIADYVNFNLTNKFVFNSKENSRSILIKYYHLSFFKMFLSSILVLLISKFIFISKPIIKIFVDTLIYFISYKVQKKYIFKT